MTDPLTTNTLLDEAAEFVAEKQTGYSLVRQLADAIERLIAERDDAEQAAATNLHMEQQAKLQLATVIAENVKLTKYVQNYCTVMVAAAEEIAEHWDAHCDKEGYGPSNLMYRLENGIPGEYGYTAGAFANLKAERDRLREAVTQWCDWVDGKRTDLNYQKVRDAFDAALGDRT